MTNRSIFIYAYMGVAVGAWRGCWSLESATQCTIGDASHRSKADARGVGGEALLDKKATGGWAQCCCTKWNLATVRGISPTV